MCLGVYGACCFLMLCGLCLCVMLVSLFYVFCWCLCCFGAPPKPAGFGRGGGTSGWEGVLLPAAARCDMVLHRVSRARVYEKPASAVRCDMMLHRVFRARHVPKTVRCDMVLHRAAVCIGSECKLHVYKYRTPAGLGICSWGRGLPTLGCLRTALPNVESELRRTGVWRKGIFKRNGRWS